MILSVVLLASLAGCNSSGVGRIVPVKGKITVDGKPLTIGSLVFKPDAAKGNPSQFGPAATIAADGSYSLFTKEKQGAPLGWYKVGVVAQEADPGNPYGPMKSLVPQRYNDAESSGLAIEVVAAPTPGTYDLKLAR
ncbi:MAG TPA: hypothetical protein VKH44_05505 [Pirellulaceae bacterium]|nr:hypothetical protein [Pirellulaceae bacterium]